MEKSEYKEKLKQFNSTPKYRREIGFLLRLMQPNEREKILDYGCGLGNLVHKIRRSYNSECFGYDVNNYRENDDEFLFRQSYFFKFDKVYFMHSIAHIPQIDEKLIALKELLNHDAKIYVITPNAFWLFKKDDPNYVKDPTVISHFDVESLSKTFEENGYTVLNQGQFGQISEGVNERLFIEAIWNGR